MRIAVLACAVFEQEIALHSRGAAHIAECRFLEIALHDCPAKMRTLLQENMDAVEAREDIEAVVLAYGLCGLGTAGLRPRRHKLVIPRAHDCVTIFLGSKEAYREHQQRCPTCYYYSPGWNRSRRVPGPERTEAMRAEYLSKFDPEDAEFLMEQERTQWAQHDTVAYVELGTEDAEAEAAYARRCADWLGWKFERLRCDPALMRDLLWCNWDDRRFLIVEPGMQTAHAVDDTILRAERTETETPAP
jgi:hypothetical protein